MTRQWRDVLLALPQRRQLDHDDVDAIKEILAKPSDLSLGLEIARGRREHPRIDPACLLVANAADLTLLENAQQLGLQSDGTLTDLVEQQRAAAGLLEQPCLVGRSTRKRAADVTEQLRLEQRLGNGGAIDADKRLGGARAGAVNGAGDHFLSGATLPGDQDGRVVLGDACDERQRLPHRAALDDQSPLRRPGGQLCLESRHLLPQPLALLRFAQRQDDFVGTEWLGEIVVGTLFHRGNGRVFAAIGAHHDDEGAAAALAIIAQEGQAIHLGHAHVAQHEVERLSDRPVERSAAVLFGRYGIAGVGEEETEALTQARLVVDDQDAFHRASAIGKNSLKAAPPSRAPSTHTTPPISWTERATIARPSPVPRPGSLVV